MPPTTPRAAAAGCRSALQRSGLLLSGSAQQGRAQQPRRPPHLSWPWPPPSSPRSSFAAAAAAPTTPPAPFPPAEPLPNAAPPLPAGTRVTLPVPDDWHLHLRDGPAMAAVAPHSARHFKRAVIMPNLSPQPVTTVAAARAYRSRIRAALEAAAERAERAAERGEPGLGGEDPGLPARLRAFEPLMTLYLTDATPESEVEEAAAASAASAAAAAAGGDGGGGGDGRLVVAAFKLYPAGATTNSSQGVTGDLSKALPAVRAMARLGLPLCVHGEVTRPDVDIFDREAFFLRERLAPLLDAVPDLRVVLEHITTADAAEFVLKHGGGGSSSSSRPQIAATVTPQHLLLNRNALLVGGVRPHAYCLPVLKRERHRAAVLRAATLPPERGGDRFFLGTDSAPHPRGAKEGACGCAGVYSAPCALALYAAAFEQAGALADGRFASFASRNGPRFYGVPVNDDGAITLVKQAEGEGEAVPEAFAFGGENEVVVPMWAGQRLAWRVERS
jgi:dihydroorotase